jgi:hypothetical protein
VQLGGGQDQEYRARINGGYHLAGSHGMLCVQCVFSKQKTDCRTPTLSLSAESPHCRVGPRDLELCPAAGSRVIFLCILNIPVLFQSYVIMIYMTHK